MLLGLLAYPLDIEGGRSTLRSGHWWEKKNSPRRRLQAQTEAASARGGNNIEERVIGE